MLSPTLTDPCYVPGSQNILTSIKGYAERRPGFAITDASVFNNLQRVFTWDRNDGSFFKMYCDVNASGQAVVYKQNVLTDNSPVSIYTDTASSTPFDFVVSNNTVYFSNGHVAKKWDPVNGVSNWGIAIGSVNNATGPNGAGTGTDVAATGSTGVWANPGNITAADAAYATVTLAAGGSTQNTGARGGSSASGWVNSTNVYASDGNYATVALTPLQTGSSLKDSAFGFGSVVPSNATINGIAVSIVHAAISGGGTVQDNNVQLLKASIPTGNNKATNLNWGAETVNYGGASDLWGTTWTPSDINNSGFGLTINVKNTDPINSVTAGIDYISITVYYTLPTSSTVSDYLEGTNFAFGIASTATISGILVEVKGFQTQNVNTSLQATLLKSGNVIGATKTGVMLPGSNGFVSYGGTGDLWGTTWTFNDVNQTTFGVALQAINASNASTSWSVDFVRITIYGVGGPSVTTTAGTLTATVGFQYVFCYGNSNTGHVSSPTPVSSQIKPVAQGVQVSLTASTDPQVNQIRVFRTTDSVAVGTTGATFFELPTSPYPNTTANITDNAIDTALNQFSIAPLPGFNDPPIPFRGPVYFSGRIWGFVNNQVWFSALEENTIGVPEESFVSGIAGNFWNFDQPTQGLAVAGSANAQTLAIFCGGRLYGIVGSSLDTFRKFTISKRRGCRNLTAITELDGMVAWFDSSGQVWSTDGSSMEELGTHIRPDLVGLSASTVSMTFHVSGVAHWLVVSTGAKLFVYDLDTEQWMPPWTVAAQYVYSGETSAGNYQLFAATPTASYTASTISHNDAGATYQMIGKTSLMAVVPDFGTRFSSLSVGLYDEPSRTGLPCYFQVDTSAAGLGDVSFVADDDPTNSATAYTSISANATTPQIAWTRGQGTYLIQNVYGMTQPLARWIGWQWKSLIADDTFKVYGFFMAYEQK